MYARERRRRRGVEKRLEEILAAVGLSPPFDPVTLCDRFGERRGRSIALVARPIPIGPVSGFLIGYRTRDVVVYQSNASRHHRDHIVYHEFCHLAFEHLGPGEIACRPSGAATVAPGTGRQPFHDREWEAEYGATLLSAWSEVRGGRGRPDAVPAGPASGLASALGGRWR